MTDAEQKQQLPLGVRRCSLAEVDRPDSPWNLAAAKAMQADPFCCRTEWQLSSHLAFYPDRQLQVWAGGNSVVAFAERHDEIFGPLLEPVEASWLFGSPLLGPDAIELLNLLLAHLETTTRPPSVLISGIIPDSPMRQRLLTTLHSRYRLLGVGHSILCSASLAGGFDGFLARRTGRLRRNLRQQARRARDLGVTYERHAPSSATEVAAVYPRIIAVEEASWKGIGQCGMAESPSREFYDLMMHRLAAAGNGRVVFARCGNDDIGYIFGGVAGKVYRGQQFSFADGWRAHSIGNLLQIELLRWLCEEGVERYDMGPKMPYKRHWTEIETRIDTWLSTSTVSGQETT